MQSFRRIKMFKIFIAFDNYIECLPVGHPGPLDLPDLPNHPDPPDLPSLPSQAIAVAVAAVPVVAVARAVITIEKVINLIIITNMIMEIDEILFLSIF